MTDATRAAPATPKHRRAFWLKQLHRWHWISSAISLMGLLLFTITGITLNHAGEIGATPNVVERQGTLPAPLLRQVAADEAPDSTRKLPAPVADYLEQQFHINARGDAEWTPEEINLPLPRPGGDGFVTIDRTDGALVHEETSRGWIAYLNDLHKGRNVGPVWKWFIDIFAVASLIFAITGLVLLYLHSRRRPSTWPLVGFGLLVPLLLAIFFIH